MREIAGRINYLSKIGEILINDDKSALAMEHALDDVVACINYVHLGHAV